MRLVILDYDGVILRSELAKALGWVVAALYIGGEVPEGLLHRLRAGNREAVGGAYGWVCERWPHELEAVVALSGLSREATCRAVWEKLLNDYEGPLGLRDLDLLRASIKDPLLLAYSEPIGGTVEFIQAARGRLSLGLVTQAAQLDVDEQAKAFTLPIDAFQVIECCGDPFYKGMPRSTDTKAVAYAVACAKLGVRPSETIAVEDSASGLDAATAAGLFCIGLKEQHNRQDLSLAKLIVGDLGQLAQPGIIEMIAGTERESIIEVVRRYTNT